VGSLWGLGAFWSFFEGHERVDFLGLFMRFEDSWVAYSERVELLNFRDQFSPSPFFFLCHKFIPKKLEVFPGEFRKLIVPH
jgi:hypothetical protein